MTTQPKQDLPPWQWPEEHWRRIVAQARAGKRLAPKAWPGGARFAVALSFDADHETNDLREGGTSISRQSWGEYGARRAIPRLRAILSRHQVAASFYTPAVSALLHSEQQRELVAEGHEIGLHGWIHEVNSTLPEAAERDLMLRAADTLEKVCGRRPVGLRTPSWDYSPNTLKLALEMGLEYDSSMMSDDDCYELVMDGQPTGLVEVPVHWTRDDAVYFGMNRWTGLRPYTSPEAVLDIFSRELFAAADEGGLFQLTCHPHHIGQRSRVWIIEELIRLAKSKGAWFGTHAQVAGHVRACASEL